MAPGYKFVEADLLFYEKTRQFITTHREQRPEQPFFAVLATQIAHAPRQVVKADNGNAVVRVGQL